MKYNLSAIMTYAHSLRKSGYALDMSIALRWTWEQAKIESEEARKNPCMKRHFTICELTPAELAGSRAIAADYEQRLFMLDMIDRPTEADRLLAAEFRRIIRANAA